MFELHSEDDNSKMIVVNGIEWHYENNLSTAPGEVKSIDGKFFLALDSDTKSGVV